MYHKVLLLEIKEEHCIALTEDGNLVRIKKKDNMNVGDRIYVLEEDLITGDNSITKSTSLSHIQPLYKFRRIALVAAAILLFFSSVMMNFSNNKAYSVVSLDGKNRIQVEISKNNTIKSAKSFNGNVKPKLLKEIIGMEFNESKEKLLEIADAKDSTLIIGYSTINKDENIDSLKKQIAFETDNPKIYIQGKPSDVKKSIKKENSLGMVILKNIAEKDDFEKILENDLNSMTLLEILEGMRSNIAVQSNGSTLEAINRKIAELTKEDEKVESDEEENKDTEQSYDINESYENNSPVPPSPSIQVPATNHPPTPAPAVPVYDDDDDFDDDDYDDDD